MLKRIRQLSILVPDLEKGIKRWSDMFGLNVTARQDLNQFGLINALMPMEDTFIELLQPVAEESAGARYLKRTDGMGGMYLLILESEDTNNAAETLKSKGVQLTGISTGEGIYQNLWIHPRSAHGSFIELGQPIGDDPWPPGGVGWQDTPKSPILKNIRQVAIMVHDLDKAIDDFNNMFGIKPRRQAVLQAFGLKAAYIPFGDEETVIELLQPITPDSAGSRFLAERGEGLYLLIFEVYDFERAIERVQSAGGRITQASRQGEFHSAWVHPLSTGGVFIQLSKPTGDNPWPPSGA